MLSFTVFKGSKDGTIQKSSTTRPDLKGDQIFLRITASGLYSTDLYYRNVDIALGYEGCGVVKSIGYDIVVFSGTDSKKREAIKLGTNHFYATKGVSEINSE
ncbi:hypothetical protein H2199_002361 [Coniosporium tulheliwenetii]|uniref:Uncharacterized protein n=1 Tax=Coniosporium tulheliwenetii TaxID=3383036 RepID=A0ACC2ZIM5_9PEZI|nr:hypothetical protein H2199_002361 [Cladosporium sp. JES 115]